MTDEELEQACSAAMRLANKRGIKSTDALTIVAAYRNALKPQPEQVTIQHMVNRFLAWALPKDFYPDNYISFDGDKAVGNWPTGTNLFTAEQASSMFSYCMESGVLSSTEYANGYDAGYADGSNASLNALPPSPEPISQEVFYAFRRKGLDYYCTCDESRYLELLEKPSLFEVRKFYTEPDMRDWQPIETAPMDGTKFVGYRDGTVGDAYRMQNKDWETWYFRGTMAAVELMPSVKPTHWQPLVYPEGEGR